MEDEITEEEFDREFAMGKPVKVRAELKGSILSIRMERTLLYRLAEYAREKGIGTTTAARQLIDEGLKLDANQRNGLADVLERVADKLRETDSLSEPATRPRQGRKSAAPKPKAGRT